jgi:hypothetical protein
MTGGRIDEPANGRHARSRKRRLRRGSKLGEGSTPGIASSNGRRRTLALFQ